jgi:hypothetical protein
MNHRFTIETSTIGGGQEMVTTLFLTTAVSFSEP